MLIYWAKLKKFLFVASKEVTLDMLRKLSVCSCLINRIWDKITTKRWLTDK
jgi:hypothetical protein